MVQPCSFASMGSTLEGLWIHKYLFSTYSSMVTCWRTRTNGFQRSTFLSCKGAYVCERCVCWAVKWTNIGFDGEWSRTKGRPIWKWGGRVRGRRPWCLNMGETSCRSNQRRRPTIPYVVYPLGKLLSQAKECVLPVHGGRSINSALIYILGFSLKNFDRRRFMYTASRYHHKIPGNCLSAAPRMANESPTELLALCIIRT